MGAIVGIDLGTTHTAVAYVNEAGLPEIIPNAEGDMFTPSVVLFERDTAIVGAVAREALTTDPERVVQLVKRQMGSSWTFTCEGRVYRPEQISALILRKVIQDARGSIGPIDGAVITVPAYFNDGMRSATKLAGEMAGLNVLALISEPTAAAIAFGLQKRVQDGCIVVCDLGGGTFDVTVMNISSGDLQVVATGGDNFLGGANFDKRIYDAFVLRFKQEHGVDVNHPSQIALPELARVAREWLKKAERMKRDLTMRTQASTSLTAMGKAMRIELSRDEFEAMSQVLLQEVETRIRDTLADAGLPLERADMVFLVGGSTRMPMVRELIARIFRKQPNIAINPDQAVALGAALYGVKRALEGGKIIPMPDTSRRRITDFTITDVAAHSLGIQAYDRPPTRGGKLYNATVLRRNVALPFSGSEVFYTSKAGQTSITLEVLEGDEPDISLCLNIGWLNIKGLPAGRPAGMPIIVTMRYNQDGILEVEAIDQETGMVAQTVTERTAALSDEEQAQATAVVKSLMVDGRADTPALTIDDLPPDFVGIQPDAPSWVGRHHEMDSRNLPEPTSRSPSPPGARGVAPHLSDIRFTAYCPKEVTAAAWHPLYAYVHELKSEAEVHTDARLVLGSVVTQTRATTEPARLPIALGALITVTPQMESCRFNPASASVHLNEPHHRLDFRFLVDSGIESRALNGVITFTIAGIIVADVPISVYVGSTVSDAEPVAHAQPAYERVFCSYSHRDAEIVRHVESAYSALGIECLRDVVTLRSGEKWQDRILGMIDESNVFQLFWSRNAARSEYVSKEWHYALGLGREQRRFIRPVFWVQPMPPPPQDLGHLHFVYNPEFARVQTARWSFWRRN